MHISHTYSDLKPAPPPVTTHPNENVPNRLEKGVFITQDPEFHMLSRNTRVSVDIAEGGTICASFSPKALPGAEIHHFAGKTLADLTNETKKSDV